MIHVILKFKCVLGKLKFERKVIKYKYANMYINHLNLLQIFT